MNYYDPTKVAALLAAVQNIQNNWSKNLTEPMAVLTKAAEACTPERPAEIYVLALDSRHGGTELLQFATEKEMWAHLIDHVFGDDTDDHCAEALAALQEGEYDEVDDILDNSKDPMDTWNYDKISIPYILPAKIIVEIEGGVLQDFTANVPLELYRFDWDNIEDSGHDHSDNLTPEREAGTAEGFEAVLEACKGRCEDIQKAQAMARDAKGC